MPLLPIWAWFKTIPKNKLLINSSADIDLVAMNPDQKSWDSIRVLHITFRSDFTGGPKHLLFLLERIKESALPVDSYVCAPMGKCYGAFQDLSKKILPLWKICFYLVNVIRIVRFCRKNNIELIHSHGRGAGLYSRIVKLLFPVTVVHTLHGAHRSQTVQSRIKIFLDRWLKHLTDAFICVSSDEYEQAMTFHLISEEKTNVIVNAVDYRSIDNALKKINKRSNSVKGCIQIGLVGELSFHKGWDLFLNAIIRNREHLLTDNITFSVAGDGKLRPKLEGLVRENKLTDIVKFCGVYQDIIQFLADKHIFISFSCGEGLPLSVLEAMSCRLPCLLSDVVGHRSFNCDKGENCVLLFDPENPAEFYVKLKLLYDSKQRTKYGELGRKLIEQNHDPNHWASRTVSIYHKLM